MKKCLIPFLLFCASITHAQLNNSWIDFSKTYYKFKVSKTGVFRINQADLSSIGLTNTPAEQFQLWRNGLQIRLYTSVASGPLSVSDYIEFWGKKNDGQPDKNLYRDTAFQLSDTFSLETDTATYFLTTDAGNNNLRFVNAINNVAGNLLAPDAYFINKVGTSYNSNYCLGYAALVGEYVYSSSYDMGEGYSTPDINPGYDLIQTYNNLNVYTAGPANGVSLYVTAFGDALNQRNLQVKINGNLLYNDAVLNWFSIIKKQVDNIPLSIITDPNSITIVVNGYTPPPLVTIPSDRIVVGEMQLSYPSKFNFNNSSNFYFELQPSGAGNFIEIDNFNYGATAPVLYSLTDGQRYQGDIVSKPGKVRFALPAYNLGLRQFELVNEEAANLSFINTFTAKTFINYNSTSNQGDYLIITNAVLFNDGNGVNYVDQYKQYRSSVAGGSFNTKVILIDELNDQFAFGIKKHPAAIRDFIRFAVQQFAVKPKYVLILGRGVTALEYKQHATDPSMDKLDLVQTFGWPASDVLLACNPGQNVPLVPIGRIAAINGTELKAYLNKVKQYELVQSSASQTINDKGWMKNAINVSGGSDPSESDLFVSYLNDYKQMLQDSLYGGSVQTFIKESSTAVEQANGESIKALINGGVSLIQYFGHSSANTLAFNLDDPTVYSNQGKYPIFNISGCSAGNFYIFDVGRLGGNLTLSEKYVLADQGGSIAFIASTFLGIPPFLNIFNAQLYKDMSLDAYGSSIGNQLQKTLKAIGSNTQSLDFYTRIHLEELNLHGDPAIKLNAFALPDYVIEDQLIKISPSIISVADKNFTVKVKWMNIGKATKDSITVSVIRKLPNDVSQVLYNLLVPAVKFADSLSFTIPINPNADKGLNKIIISLDPDNRVTELSETNNNFTKEFYILEDEIRPASPYNYSIVNKPGTVFTASTANPLTGQRQYVMELDTTALFNSSFKKQYTVTGTGGVVEFKPGNLSFADSTVYYWRTSIVPLVSGTQPIWNSASFVYLPNSSSGFNLSHYFQQIDNTFGNTITLDNDRVYRFTPQPRSITIRTGLYPYTNFDKINVNVDFAQVEQYGCAYYTLQFFVYDTATLVPWVNFNSTDPVTGKVTGRFGSGAVCNTLTRNFFEFDYTTAANRKKAMDFMDQLPNGMFVSLTNLSAIYNNTFIDAWKADRTLYGGTSLYDKLISAGFSTLDSFTRNIPFIFFYKKNTPSFTPIQNMGKSDQNQPVSIISLPSRNLSGTISSPVFGPAKNWNSLHWNGKSIDPVLKDSVVIQVYGVTAGGAETLVATVFPATDTSLSFINAVTYPFLKLKMFNSDSTFGTPNQLNYWRVNADYVPEGAVAPNILFTMKDTAEQGEKINFSVAFKNISEVAFDSLKVSFVITDRNNAPHSIVMPKRKALTAGDTLVVNYSIDTKAYPGNNTLYVMVNPDNSQPEQYLFNNFIYKNFYVKEDKFNPLLDVTFDGVHILNRDIVAARPHILIKLKDDSHFMALSDTSLLKLQVRYPDGTLHNYFFVDAVKFTPANLSSGENAASIDFAPNFPLDGDYQFMVSGKDVIGNTAGALQYQVTFSIINKPMISNMLNYPNPFTTSTAFVFTVTGSDVPQNIRIQILTITGKIVRDITKNELGPIHIGRNITDYKWDGTDSYGQKLANGVYLYRVITNLNGKSLDKYTSQDDNTDQYFTKGYGKMYLMR